MLYFIRLKSYRVRFIFRKNSLLYLRVVEVGICGVVFLHVCLCMCSAKPFSNSRHVSCTSGAEDQVTGLGLVSRMAAMAVTRDDLTCVRRDLCQLVREGRRAGRPYDTALPLARSVYQWIRAISLQHFSHKTQEMRNVS